MTKQERGWHSARSTHNLALRLPLRLPTDSERSREEFCQLWGLGQKNRPEEQMNTMSGRAGPQVFSVHETQFQVSTCKHSPLHLLWFSTCKQSSTNKHIHMCPTPRHTHTTVFVVVWCSGLMSGSVFSYHSSQGFRTLWGTRNWTWVSGMQGKCLTQCFISLAHLCLLF